MSQTFQNLIKTLHAFLNSLQSFSISQSYSQTETEDVAVKYTLNVFINTRTVSISKDTIEVVETEF